jgi:hypothetical protein
MLPLCPLVRVWLPAWQWYINEYIERPYMLHRARCMHDDHVAREQFPLAPVSVYLRERAAAGMALPEVEVVAQQAVGPVTRSRRKRNQEDEEERDATVAMLVEELPRELHIELMEGLTGRMLEKPQPK